MTSDTAWDAPLASVVEEAGIGVWRWDPATNTVEWDQRTEQLYGLEPGTFDGTMEAYLGMIHPDDVDDALELIQSVAATGGLYSIRHRIVWPDGAVRWIEGQGRIDVEPDGTPVRGLGIVYDVTERATLEHERDELRLREAAAVRASVESRDALDFLIRAADALAGSLNTSRVIERLAQVLTSGPADIAVVDVRLDEPIGWIATCTRNAANHAQAIHSGPASLMAGAAARLAVADTGADVADTADLLAVDAPELGKALAGVDAAAVDIVHEPLVSRGTTIGSLVAVRLVAPWSTEERSLLRAVARRAAVALNHALLYRDQSAVAAVFQRSMSPGDLPEIPGLDLGVLYRPATELVRLGGDLYDVFPSGRGSWTMAVGDVCGKGVHAAGHAGLTRAALRAAVQATSRADEALEVLNRTLLADSSRPMLTAVVASVGGCDSDGSRRVEVYCAGHPSPLVVRRDGLVEALEARGTMLGYADDAGFEGVATTLQPGDALVLFSDGVIDCRRGKDFFGVERLSEALSPVAGSSAEVMTSAVGAAMDAWTAEAPRDDIVLLAARVVDAA